MSAIVNLPSLDLTMFYVIITEMVMLEWIAGDIISHNFITNFLFELSFSIPATSLLYHY